MGFTRLREGTIWLLLLKVRLFLQILGGDQLRVKSLFLLHVELTCIEVSDIVVDLLCNVSGLACIHVRGC